MAVEFLKDKQSGNIFDIGLIRETFDPPLAVPENDWILVQSLEADSIENGLYMVWGAVIYTAGSTNKSNLFRLIENGSANAPIDVELKDTQNILYLPFQTWINVTDKQISIQIEGRQEDGAGQANLLVYSSFLLYWKVSSKFTQVLNENPFINREEQAATSAANNKK